jgi:hypothetical protein
VEDDRGLRIEAFDLLCPEIGFDLEREAVDPNSRRRQLPDPTVAIGLGAFYIVFGAAAYAYARDPFWLFFLAQGVMLLGATLGLPNQPKMSAA